MDMNGYRIVNCAQPINQGDVVTKAYSDNQYMPKSTQLQDLVVKTGQNIDVNGNKVQNVKDATLNNDAVNLK